MHKNLQNKEHNTELGNAKRLVRQYGNELRYCESLKTWFVWDGKRWKSGMRSDVVKRMNDTVHQMFKDAAEITDSETREKALKWALRSESKTIINNSIELAQSDSTIDIEEFDPDPMLLNVQNGTIDLKTGKLFKHDRDKFITKICPVMYNPDATVHTWLGFLEKIMNGNKNLIDFLQRALGYSLSGDASEQVFFLLYGSGANGKSTFLETIKSVLGDYAKVAEFSTFTTLKNTGGVRNDIADLKGARCVIANEGSESQRLSESVVKSLTGEDTIKARFLFKEHFEYKPEYKIWLATNNKPDIQGTDHAIWRRVKLIPFSVRIQPREQDKKLLIKLRNEFSGILNWAIKGALKWKMDGLGEPAEVTEATKFYRDEMDILSRFLDERCRLSPEMRAGSTNLYKEYKDWSDQSGENPLSQTKFGTRLNEKGFNKNRSGSDGGYRWLGIGIQEKDMQIELRPEELPLQSISKN